MKSNLVSASVLAVSALAFFGSASSFAEGRDPFPLDQASAVSTKTRAEVKSEVLQAQKTDATSSFNGVTAQQNLAAPRAEKAGAAPQAAAELVKTNAQ